jgi:hypothetical protein
MLQSSRTSKQRRFTRGATLAIISLLALVFSATALAWSHYYVDHQTMVPGGFQYSDFNSGINYNETLWSGGIMQTTLCNSGGSCYDYSPGFNGFHQDFRSISYGRAKCQSYSGNPGNIFAYHCYASN